VGFEEDEDGKTTTAMIRRWTPKICARIKILSTFPFKRKLKRKSLRVYVTTVQYRIRIYM